MEEKETEKRGILEGVFEDFLFNCRFFVLLAVVGTLVASFVMFLKGCIEIVQGVGAFGKVMTQFHSAPTDDKSIILSFIPAIDNYLFATILLIFSMGIYELFISKIDPARRKATTQPTWLSVSNLDDLKTQVGKVVIMILIVNLFEHSVTMTYEHPVDLLYLGGGIILVAGSLLITQSILHRHKGEHSD